MALAVMVFFVILILGVAFCLAESRAIRSKEGLNGNNPKKAGIADAMVFCGAVLYSFFHVAMDFSLYLDYEFPAAAMEKSLLTLTETLLLVVLVTVPALIFGYVVYRCRDRVVKFALAVAFLLADFVMILFGLGGVFSHSPELIKEALFPIQGMPETSADIARGAAYIISHVFTLGMILYTLYDILGLFFSRLRGKRGAAALACMLVLTMCGLWAAGTVKQRADKKKYAEYSVLRAVVQEENGRGKTAYYGIASDKTYGAIESFNPANGMIYSTRYTGTSFEKNKLADVQVVDSKGVPAEKTQEMDHILELGEENKHSILDRWLIYTDGFWFLQVMLNVNLWTPYELYWYNPASDKLVEMTTFDGKEVVGLEVADRAYFERMMVSH